MTYSTLQYMIIINPIITSHTDTHAVKTRVLFLKYITTCVSETGSKGVNK